MADLIFKFGTDYSSKSLELISLIQHLKKNDVKYRIIKPALNDKTEDSIKTFFGFEEPCTLIGSADLLLKYIEDKIKILIVDDSHFLTKEQVDDLSYIVDKLNITVICYGLRSDNQTILFEGSKRLFEVSDKIEEIISFCSCGSKAIFNVKFDKFNYINILNENEEDDDILKYNPICRKCLRKLILDSTKYC